MAEPLTSEPFSDEALVNLRDVIHDEWCATNLDGPDSQCDCVRETILKLLANIDATRAASPDRETPAALTDAAEEGT